MIRFLCFSALLPLIVSAQITVDINSGDPAYPFPQFQPYVNKDGVLGNLASINSPGVTHAEMEKTIREAYQIQMNRADKTGESLNGIDYVKYRSNPDCSEGSGYGILGPAAMADKSTFDGMWLWIHDYAMKKVKRYNDCGESAPDYLYSQLPDWKNDYHNGSNEGSATDGDVDIALALLCAYRQWGEFMGIDDACGNPISYKQAAIDFITAMTDTLVYNQGGATLVSGDIGLDGYTKSGDKGANLTDWAASTARSGFTRPAEPAGPAPVYFDYSAPAYFHQFADFLAEEDSVKYAWNIYQFRRGEASADWLMGELYNASPRNIPYAGQVTMSEDNQPTFRNLQASEDGRLAWRTILNYVWNGNPTYTWDPSTHQIQPGVSNTFEMDFGLRYAKFLWDNREDPWGQTCVSGANKMFTYWGPMVLWTQWEMDGSNPDFFFLNWIQAWGSPSAVISQDMALMSEMYRQLEIEWDVDNEGDGYLTSVPFYFHGWFRMLGLLVLSGNYHSPADIKPMANTKVYLSIDKTFAFEKDTVTYTIDFRNYGSVDASGTTIIDTLHHDFEFVSATGGGLYNNTSHTVFWNIGTVPGFRTASGITPTTGQVELKVRIKNATEKQYRNKVSIFCSNGTGWTSNDYPNNVTAVMERNYLDIARRALLCDYSAEKTLVKPGETIEFAIEFENSSDAGWINGGRPGVNLSFAQNAEGGNATQNYMMTRLFHDAAEAYIDFGNYRISYFLYNEKDTSISADGSMTGWNIFPMIIEGIDDSSLTLKHEMIVPGQDSLGKWNQRIIIQFSDPENPGRKECLSTIDRHLSEYVMGRRVHRGGVEPLRLVWYINSRSWQPVNWSDAWSWDAKANDAYDGYFYPVTNDWTDPEKPDVPVDHWNRKACEKATKTVNNILVEEWDGYTWRRVAGNGPMPGREVNNVVIRDTIPEGFTFVAFTGENPLGIAPSISSDGRVITWTKSKMQIKEGGTIKFTVKADGSCPGFVDLQTVNRAWISADKESPFVDSSEVVVSCDTVIKPPPPDHIDIVLDTMLLDMNNDADFVRITLDEGTQMAYVYAVVRDRNGKFIRKLAGGIWTSRDLTVASAAAASASSWQGVLSKRGGGSVVVVVTDPNDPSLKPDSLAITAVETPPWPVISSAFLTDANGDVIPDVVSLTLNDTFHVNQTFDSLAVIYRGTRYVYTAVEVTLQGKALSVTIPGLTVTDPEPTGTAILYLTAEGSGRQMQKEIADGIGPSLTGVTLTQDVSGAGYDTLNLIFTEEVAMTTLVGSTLLLIRSASGDTVVLPVTAFRGPDIFRETKATVFSSAGVRPGEGDLVRLVPGVQGGTVAEKNNMLPHLLNRSVMIPERPSQLADAWYVDADADGIVEAIWLRFIKRVHISSMAVTISWGIDRFDDLTGTALAYGSDSTHVRVLLPSREGIDNVKTGGIMSVNVRFTDYVNENRTRQVRDSAAPVITKADYTIGAVESEGAEAVERFLVEFSEEVTVADVATPFRMRSKGGIDYTIFMKINSVSGNRAEFITQSVQGVPFPESGDVVQINPVSAVRDSLTFQNNEENRRVAFSVSRGKTKWEVVVAPNPFDPDVPVFETRGARIHIVNAASHSAPLVLEKARISIYDAVGSPVVVKKEFTQTPLGPVFYWDGCNLNHRCVANGTYIGIVTVEDEASQGTQRVSIGVYRGGTKTGGSGVPVGRR